MTELWSLSARELAAGIAGKHVSSREVIDAHLTRIDAVNPRLNAIVRVLADEARAAADEADRRLADGESLGPLHGVPFTVKENIDMKGLPTTWGVAGLSQTAAPSDAPVVERLRQAGAIPIGRTNLPDMALRSSTDSSLHGLTRNPWNAGRTAGGSSGGEAAALASGMSPMGLGNDIGGSLRNPANACGIVAVRPTAGRVPSAGHIPNEDYILAMQLMNVQGPMARTVVDARIGLRALMGAHPRDPWSLDAPFEGRPLTKPIRVAIVDRPPGAAVDPAVSAAVTHAADALANAGYDVVAATPPRYEEAVEIWTQFVVGDFMSEAEALGPLLGAPARGYFESFIRATPLFSDAADMSRLLQRRHGLARDWSLFMETHPLVLTPTWTRLPFEHGFDVAHDDSAGAIIDIIRPVVLANLLGLPSVCVPGRLDPESGLPVGVLLNGQRLREDLCLEAAEFVEANSGVHTPIDPAF